MKPDRVDENERLVRAVYAELHWTETSLAFFGPANGRAQPTQVLTEYEPPGAEGWREVTTGWFDVEGS